LLTFISAEFPVEFDFPARLRCETLPAETPQRHHVELRNQTAEHNRPFFGPILMRRPPCLNNNQGIPRSRHLSHLFEFERCSSGAAGPIQGAKR
jgi:hypothetical protein